MLKLSKRVIAAILSLSICILAICGTAYADTKKIKELRDTVEDNRKEVEETKKAAEKLGNDIKKEKGKLTETNNELTNLEEELAGQHYDMKKRIQYLYENGDISTISAIFSGSYSSLLNRQDMFFNIHMYDRMKLNEYSSLVQETEGKKKELEAGIQELEEMEKEQAALLEKLEKLLEKNKKVLSMEIKKEKRRKKLELKRKQEEARRMAEAKKMAERDMPTGKYTADGGKYSYRKEDLQLIYAIVMQECNVSYEGALAVITCACNRAESPRWQYLGRDPLSQLTARGQFCYSIDNYWRKYLGNNVSQIVRDAVHDALNGKRNHRFLSFRGYVVKGSTKIGDNYFFSPM